MMSIGCFFLRSASETSEMRVKVTINFSNQWFSFYHKKVNLILYEIPYDSLKNEMYDDHVLKPSISLLK